MNTVILYAAQTALTPEHQRIQVGEEGVVFIRAVTDEADLQTALDAARPMDGETVLNSVEFTPTLG